MLSTLSYMFRPVMLLCLLHLLILAVVGQAAPVKTDYATVELISEESAIVPGQSFSLAVHFDLAEHWHIYWQNPGASGLAPELTWELPEGIEAGAIQWPVPERFSLGGLVNYGYEDEVTFIVPMTASESLQSGEELMLKLELFFLICEEACLPAVADLEIKLPVAESSQQRKRAAAFEQARASQPILRSDWSIGARVDGEALVLTILGDEIPADLYFYASAEGITDPSAEQVLSYPQAGRAELRVLVDTYFLEEPVESLSGLLQSPENTWVVEFTMGEPAPKELKASGTTVEPEPVGFEQTLLSLGLPGFLALAFLGGLILNVMPCVLPVLSLKVFSLLKHAGQTRSEALKHGLAYTVGVVLSFLVLAGVLLALRAVGERIGWGFQLQSPGFVVVLAAVFFLFGLNLMGVFELGSRLVGADAKVAQRSDALGSFGMGVLAAVVGAPCMGPLVAGVSGIAVQANAITGLLIFGMMGLGLASPFLLLSVFPKLVAFLPKPGAWMESFKQGMGFLLMAAVVFLVLVAGQQGGVDAIYVLLVVVLLGAVAAWIFGRWGAPVRSKRSQWIAKILALVLLGGSLVWAVPATKSAYADYGAKATRGDASRQWQGWSSEKVDARLAEGQPVFVDFTATWCLICQVNKKVALRTDATADLFEEYNIAALSADWTRRDPEITEALESFDRSGVPLYVLYSPDGEFSVLPQSLTNGIVREAVEKALVN